MSFDWTPVVIGAIAGGILTPLLLKFVMASSKKSEIKDGYKQARFSLSSKVTIWICFVFFCALSILPAQLPGKSGPVTIILVCTFFGLFALISFATAISMYLADVIYQDETISGVDFICRRKTFKWEDINRVEYVAWAQCVRITADDGSAIWISPMMNGFDDIMDKLDEVCSKNGVKVPKLKGSGTSFH